MIFYLFQEPIYLVSVFDGGVEPELDRGYEFHLQPFTEGGTEEGLCVIQYLKRLLAVLFFEDANEYARELEIIGHVHPCDRDETYSRVFQPIHDNVSNLFTDEVAYSLGTLIWQHGSPHYLSFPT